MFSPSSPRVIAHARDEARLRGVRLVSVDRDGWARWAVTWDDEHAPQFDCAVRVWRCAMYGRESDVEHVEISPDNHWVYFDGCLADEGDVFSARCPTHGYGTERALNWAPDGGPLLFVKTWNHMLSVSP